MLGRPFRPHILQPRRHGCQDRPAMPLSPSRVRALRSRDPLERAIEAALNPGRSVSHTLVSKSGATWTGPGFFCDRSRPGSLRHQAPSATTATRPRSPRREAAAPPDPQPVPGVARSVEPAAPTAQVVAGGVAIRSWPGRARRRRRGCPGVSELPSWLAGGRRPSACCRFARSGRRPARTARRCRIRRLKGPPACRALGTRDRTRRSRQAGSS